MSIILWQTLLADIPVNFANSLPGTIAVTDFAIAEIGGRNVAVFASGSDNDVAIVDLESPTSVPKISLTSSSFASGVAGEGRSVEWAQGTEFVWLTGQEAKEIYVIQIPRGDIGRATVKTVIQGVDASALMYVENYAARAVATSLERSSRFHEAVAANQDNTLSVVSLVIACLAFVFSVALFFRVVMTRSTNKVATNGPEKTDRGSLDLAFDHLEQQAADAKSLGSKQVM